MHHPSETLAMAQGYIRIQIDFAHFRAQLTPQLALAGILEINIGTLLYYNGENLRDRRLFRIRRSRLHYRPPSTYRSLRVTVAWRIDFYSFTRVSVDSPG